MKILDLRKYLIDNIKPLCIKDNCFIFAQRGERNKQIFYEYNFEADELKKVFEAELPFYENIYGNQFILNDYLYVDDLKSEGEEKLYSIYKISLTDEKAERIYNRTISQDDDIYYELLDSNYILIYIDNFEINKDIHNYITGSYRKCFLYSLNQAQHFEISDRRIIMGLKNNFRLVNANNDEYLVFREAYVEEDDKRECFKEKLSYNTIAERAFNESLNVISLKDFVNQIQNSGEIKNFYKIEEADLSKGIKIFFNEGDYIYYVIDDFKSNSGYIKSFNLSNLKKETLKQFSLCNSKEMYDGCGLWQDENLKAIYLKCCSEDRSFIKEIFKGNMEIYYENNYGDIAGILNNYLVTQNLDEETISKVYIKNLSTNEVCSFDGLCCICEDKVIIY